MERRRHELADAQWEEIEDLLPGKTSDPGRTRRRQSRIERPVCRVKRCRRVATRYEKQPANFAGFVYLAAFVTAEE